MKVYGPYTRKDGRQHVVIVDNGVKRTVSYPKYLLEQKLGRSLEPWETCDHIDNDFTNNALDNLQVLSKSDNSKKANAFNKAEVILCVCPECSSQFFRRASDIRFHQHKQNKAGPFCSKSCSGRYGRRLNKTVNGGHKNTYT